MPKRSQRAPDLDWDRVEYMQNPPESGKGRDARGGNFRVSPKLFCEKIEKIKGNHCQNQSCEHWCDKRIRLNCNLYNGDKAKILDCPERKNND